MNWHSLELWAAVWGGLSGAALLVVVIAVETGNVRRWWRKRRGKGER